VDLETDAIDRTIVVPPDTTYLNDIRFDLRRGYALITDSTIGEGPGRTTTRTARTGARSPTWWPAPSSTSGRWRLR
jgi:hypothetical protein